MLIAEQPEVQALLWWSVSVDTARCSLAEGYLCCPVSNIIMGLQPQPFNALMLLLMVSIEKQDGSCLCLA